MIGRRALLGAFCLLAVAGDRAAGGALNGDLASGRWDAFIAESAARFAIPEAWIRAVMVAESGGRTHLAGRPIRSPAGAIGLMQLMPATWAEMRQQHGLGPDPDDPRDNILAGTAYLRAMFDRFGYPGLFAAYNAGPARYTASLAGQTLPAETRAYLAKVTQATGANGEGAAEIPPTLTPSDQGLFAIKRTPETAF